GQVRAGSGQARAFSTCPYMVGCDGMSGAEQAGCVQEPGRLPASCSPRRTMIRHVIMVKFKPEATDENIGFLHAFWEESRTRYQGMLGLPFGRDAGLRAGNWTTVAVYDFVDEAAWRDFDSDAYHNEVRAQLP